MAKVKKKGGGPLLYLHDVVWKDLEESLDTAANALSQRYCTRAKQATPEAVAFADKVAGLLADVVHGSDTDCEYFACVFEGVDLADDDAFFGAMGVDPKAEVPTCDGSPAPELLTVWAYRKGRRKKHKFITVELLMGIDDDELDEVDEYFSKEEQEAYWRAAEALEATGAVISGQLIPDPVTKIRFLVGKRSRTSWAGVLTVRIDT